MAREKSIKETIEYYKVIEEYLTREANYLRNLNDLEGARARITELNSERQRVINALLEEQGRLKAEGGDLDEESLKILKEYIGTQRTAIANLKIENEQLTKAVERRQIILDLSREFNNQLKLGLRYLMDSDKAIRQSILNLGMSGVKAAAMRQSFEDSAGFVARLGGNLEDIRDIMTGFAEETGRARVLSAEMVKDVTKIGKGTAINIEGATKLAAQFEYMGLDVKSTMEYVQGVVDTSERMGVNTTKVLKNISDNFKKLSTFTFQKGVKAFAEMAQYGEKTRVSMASALDVAEATRGLEQVVDMAAQLQVMGGAFAETDPLQWLYMARNEPEKLTEKLSEMTRGLYTFRKMSDGTFEKFISPADRDRLASVAKTLGIAQEEMFEIAQRRLDLDTMERALAGKGLTKREKDLIQGAATWNKEKSRFEVSLSGTIKDISSLTKEQALAFEKEQVTLEERAKAAQTFEEALKATLMEIKAGLLPILKTVNKVLERIRPVLVNVAEFLSKHTLLAALALVGAAVSWKAVTIGLGMAADRWIKTGSFFSKMLGRTPAGIGGGAAGAGGGMAGAAGGGLFTKTGTIRKGAPELVKAQGVSGLAKGAGMGVALAGAGAGIAVAAVGISKLADAMSKLTPEQAKTLQIIVRSLVIFTGIAAGLALAVVAFGSAATAASVGLLAFGAAILMIGAGVGIAALGIGKMAEGLAKLVESGKGAGSSMLSLGGGIAMIAASMAALTFTGGLGILKFVGLLKSIGKQQPMLVSVGESFKSIGGVLTAKADEFTRVQKALEGIANIKFIGGGSLESFISVLSKGVPDLVKVGDAFKEINLVLTTMGAQIGKIDPFEMLAKARGIGAGSITDIVNTISKTVPDISKISELFKQISTTLSGSKTEFVAVQNAFQSFANVKIDAFSGLINTISESIPKLSKVGDLFSKIGNVLVTTQTAFPAFQSVLASISDLNASPFDNFVKTLTKNIPNFSNVGELFKQINTTLVASQDNFRNIQSTFESFANIDVGSFNNLVGTITKSIPDISKLESSFKQINTTLMANQDGFIKIKDALESLTTLNVGSFTNLITVLSKNVPNLSRVGETFTQITNALSTSQTSFTAIRTALESLTNLNTSAFVDLIGTITKSIPDISRAELSFKQIGNALVAGQSSFPTMHAALESISNLKTDSFSNLINAISRSIPDLTKVESSFKQISNALIVSQSNFPLIRTALESISNLNVSSFTNLVDLLTKNIPNIGRVEKSFKEISNSLNVLPANLTSIETVFKSFGNLRTDSLVNLINILTKSTPDITRVEKSFREISGSLSTLPVNFTAIQTVLESFGNFKTDAFVNLISVLTKNIPDITRAEKSFKEISGSLSALPVNFTSIQTVLESFGNFKTDAFINLVDVLTKNIPNITRVEKSFKEISGSLNTLPVNFTAIQTVIELFGNFKTDSFVNLIDVLTKSAPDISKAEKSFREISGSLNTLPVNFTAIQTVLESFGNFRTDSFVNLIGILTKSIPDIARVEKSFKEISNSLNIAPTNFTTIRTAVESFGNLNVGSFTNLISILTKSIPDITRIEKSFKEIGSTLTATQGNFTTIQSVFESLGNLNLTSFSNLVGVVTKAAPDVSKIGESFKLIGTTLMASQSGFLAIKTALESISNINVDTFNNLINEINKNAPSIARVEKSFREINNFVDASKDGLLTIKSALLSFANLNVDSFNNLISSINKNVSSLVRAGEFFTQVGGVLSSSQENIGEMQRVLQSLANINIGDNDAFNGLLKSIVKSAPELARVGESFKQISTVLRGSRDDFESVKNTVESIARINVKGGTAIKELATLLKNPLKVEFADKQVAVVSNVTLNIDGQKFHQATKTGAYVRNSSEEGKSGKSGTA